MCGIAGIVGATANRLAAAERGKALDLMKLRGPDASGEWEGENVWLGHRRLAIIDLSPRGHQPMFSPDKRYVCILNGEIYNFRDIRARLETAASASSEAPTPRCCCTPTPSGEWRRSTRSTACSRSRSGTTGTRSC